MILLLLPCKQVMIAVHAQKDNHLQEVYMFRYVISFILLFLLGVNSMCIAQQKQGLVLRPIPQEIGKVTILGNASLEVTYAFNATDLTDEQTYIDLQVLRAGRSVSKYYSRFLELDDSLCSEFKRKNSSASSIPGLFCQQGRNSNYWSEYQFTEIFSQNGTRTYYVRMPFAMQRYNCYYMEPIEQQRWQLDNDTCRILGYRCQKAHCFWRGREFEAWFASDIPTSQGPWNFGGLPGLILRLNDEERLYSWEAVKIRSGQFPVAKRNFKGYRHDTREHVLRLQVAINRDFLKVGGARDRKTGQLRSQPHPYEPLEKE